MTPESRRGLSVLLLLLSGLTAPAAGAERPNIVLMFVDDLGYADLGCYGATGWETPHLDELARQGRKFTNFYVAQAVCGASRAALLTGCYPNRIGMLGAPGPNTRTGIHEQEKLLPEICREQGYATGMFGKWHLGHHPQFLPTRHGFDVYFGLPYSNDMWPYHPERPQDYPDLPLIEGERIINPRVTPEDQVHLTEWYTQRAVEFIDQHQAQPFFLYVAHSMPHVPLFVTERFRGRSQQGLYGDVVMELDWSMGEILAALDRHGLRENTLVIFTSDNGPWLSYGNHAGSAQPLREGKGTTFEGGVRVPCIMQWPGRIPAGTVCDELTATIDVVPSLAALIGGQLPEHPLDGRNALPLWFGEAGAVSPHQAYLYYWGEHLEAIRSGDWKLHFPHQYRSLTGPPGQDGRPAGYTQGKIELSLFNLKVDVAEQHDVKDQHPEVVAELQRLAHAARLELGDSATKQVGTGVRPVGRLATTPPAR